MLIIVISPLSSVEEEGLVYMNKLLFEQSSMFIVLFLLLSVYYIQLELQSRFEQFFIWLNLSMIGIFHHRYLLLRSWNWEEQVDSGGEIIAANGKPIFFDNLYWALDTITWVVLAASTILLFMNARKKSTDIR